MFEYAIEILEDEGSTLMYYAKICPPDREKEPHEHINLLDLAIQKLKESTHA